MFKNNPFTLKIASVIWSMRPDDLGQMLESLGGMDSALCLNPIEIGNRNRMRVQGDTAFIPVRGVLMDSVPWWMRLFGDATGYDEIIENLQSAVEDSKVKNIRLDITSQGGMVSGSIECAKSISKANQIKPVTAHISDLCASGAYLLASQASKITCNENALVGSMGVYMTVADFSGYAENEGVKVHVIRSGEHKGVGVAGAEITDAHIAELQRNVDSLADIFISTVSEGRGINKTKIRQLATGAMWVGQEAKDNGLVDAVKNIIPIKQTRGQSMSTEEKLNEEQVTEPVNEEEVQVDDQQEAPVEPEETPAEDQQQPEEEPVDDTTDEGEPEVDAEAQSMQRLDALCKAFPEDDKFVLSQFRKGNTVEQAKVELCDILRTSKGSGDAPALPTSGTDDQGTGDFMEVSRSYAKENKVSIREAMSKVSREHPDLFNEYKQSK